MQIAFVFISHAIRSCCPFCDESAHQQQLPSFSPALTYWEIHPITETSGSIPHHECLTRWLNHIKLTLSWMTSQDCQGATEVVFMQVAFFFFSFGERIDPRCQYGIMGKCTLLDVFQIRIKQRSCPSQT